MNECPPVHEVEPPSGVYDAWGSAPGRVEFIGNHTDYNGGWVLGATIDRRVDVTVRRRSDRRIRMESASRGKVDVGLDELTRQEGKASWANYILGVIAVLEQDGFALPAGVDVRAESTLPVGAGLSSSAALELASALALTEAFGEDYDRLALARVCRRAENEFVGVPCGILDQAVVTFGDRDTLVRIDARTGEISSVPLPPDTQFWIFRTHQSHALVDAHYQERHDESRAARDQLEELLGGVEHLVDVSRSELESVRRELPDVLFRRARHVITEHERVRKAVRELEEGTVEVVGDLLFASHESSRRDYENSTAELDFVVDRLKGVPGVLGARLTGAGFGGAAMAWTRPAFDASDAESIKADYEDEFGEELGVMACQPAPGSFACSGSALGGA